MTPKDKAEELIQKYLNMNDGLIQEFIPIPIEGARQCALIMCDELLCNSTFLLSNGEIYFWQKVKHEIENYEQH
jgi:hypothetical protein